MRIPDQLNRQIIDGSRDRGVTGRNDDTRLVAARRDCHQRGMTEKRDAIDFDQLLRPPKAKRTACSKNDADRVRGGRNDAHVSAINRSSS